MREKVIWSWLEKMYKQYLQNKLYLIYNFTRFNGTSLLNKQNYDIIVFSFYKGKSIGFEIIFFCIAIQHFLYGIPSCLARLNYLQIAFNKINLTKKRVTK